MGTIHRMNILLLLIILMLVDEHSFIDNINDVQQQ